MDWLNGTDILSSVKAILKKTWDSGFLSDRDRPGGGAIPWVRHLQGPAQDYRTKTTGTE